MMNIVANLVIPWIIINEYGSEVNGLVQSITQFLAIVSLAEFGIGAVIQSTLYTPLLRRDYGEISRIVSTGNYYFKRIALYLVGYIIVLIFGYPILLGSSFEFIYSAVLILSIAISTFAQYYFGLIRTVFLNADLKGYIHSFLQIATLALNIISTIVLVRHGCSIQIVKLVSSVIFLVKPIFLSIYIRTHYPVKFCEKPESDSIPQLWNGVAQHVSAVILEQTDVIVLTLFSSLKTVSIYSVYHMVVYGVRAFYNSLTVGLQSAFGRLWATGNKNNINEAFSCLEVVCHFVTLFLYCCTGKLIIPFVEIYTKEIGDIDYINLCFAIIFTIAVACQCLRTPYNIMILASGSFKQTQKCYIKATAINIVLSIVLVQFMGIVGVAIGTLCALSYQTVWMAVYDYRYLLNRSLCLFLKQVIVDSVTVAIVCFVIRECVLVYHNFMGWLLLAMQVGLKVFAIVLVMSCLFYWKEVRIIISFIKKKR